MKNFKGSKGKWNIYDYDGKGCAIDVVLGDVVLGSMIAQVYDVSDVNVSYKDIQSEEHKANAQLIADAGNTIQKCDLLPSEILAQRDELLDCLSGFINTKRYKDEFGKDEHYEKARDMAWKKAKELINKINKQ